VCHTEECNFDGTDCDGVDLDSCSPGCSTQLRGNGQCDLACNTLTCYYDDGDCDLSGDDVELRGRDFRGGPDTKWRPDPSYGTVVPVSTYRDGSGSGPASARSAGESGGIVRTVLLGLAILGSAGGVLYCLYRVESKSYRQSLAQDDGDDEGVQGHHVLGEVQQQAPHRGHSPHAAEWTVDSPSRRGAEATGAPAAGRRPSSLEHDKGGHGMDLL